MKKRFSLIGLAMISLMLVAPAAHADVYTFSGSSALGSGSFTFTPGSGSALEVSGALINRFLQSIGLCSSSACTVTGGSATLSSGGQNGTMGAGGFSFDAGGVLTIIGGVAALGIPEGTTLLTATFLAGQTLQFSGTTGTFRGSLDPASINIDSRITDQSATSGTVTQSEFKVSFNAGTETYSGKVSQSSINVIATPGVIATPEAGSVLLLGVGALCLAGLLRQRIT
jgi:hypothetical protein